MENLKNKYVIHQGMIVKVHKVLNDYVYYHSRYSLMIKEHKYIFENKEIVKPDIIFTPIPRDFERIIRNDIKVLMEKYRPYNYNIIVDRINITKNGANVMSFLFNAYLFSINEDYKYLMFNQIEKFMSNVE